MASAISCLALLACLVLSITAQAPTLSGYQGLFNFTGSFVTSPGGLPATQAFVVYYSIVEPDLYIGIVCQSTAWCAFGLSHTGEMFSLDHVNDASLGFINSTGGAEVYDFGISGRIAPLYCPGQAVCLDSNSLDVCTDNVRVIGGQLVGSYSILEYARPLNASDPCDVSVNVGSSNYVIAALGTLGTGDVFPNTVQKHTVRLPAFVQRIFSLPITTGIATTGVATTGTQTTTGAQTTTGQAQATTGTTGAEVTTGAEAATTGAEVTTGAEAGTTGEAAATTGEAAGTTGSAAGTTGAVAGTTAAAGTTGVATRATTGHATTGKISTSTSTTHATSSASSTAVGVLASILATIALF